MVAATHGRDRTGHDDGIASIEVIGLLPIVLLFAGVILQLFLIASAATMAESNARVAAREYSKGSSPSSVTALVEGRMNGEYDPEVVLRATALGAAGTEPALVPLSDADAVHARVTVTVPFLGIDRFDLSISRHAVMPRTD